MQRARRAPLCTASQHGSKNWLEPTTVTFWNNLQRRRVPGERLRRRRGSTTSSRVELAKMKLKAVISLTAAAAAAPLVIVKTSLFNSLNAALSRCLTPVR